MLDFYEAYRQYDIPRELIGQIISKNAEPYDTIPNTNRINIFVGANNNGKSIILRELLKTRSKFYYSHENCEKIKSILKFFDHIIDKLQDACRCASLCSLHLASGGVVFDLNAVSQAKDKFQSISANYDIASVVLFLKSFFAAEYDLLPREYYIQESHGRRSLFSYNKGESISIRNVFSTLQELKESSIAIIDSLNSLKLISVDTLFHRIYIPSVRTLRAFALDANLKSKVINEYGFDDNYIIATGQDFPLSVLSQKATTEEEEDKILSFEMFLSEEFFDRQRVVLKYRIDDKVLEIKIGEERSRPIHKLGEGLQMVIIMTHYFFSLKGGIVAIEEPELYLHPGLQKTFINFLMRHPRLRNFQVFITTHSNHIIDSINQSCDVSIYSINKSVGDNSPELRKTPNFVLQNLAYGDQNLLTLLGITSTSVYLSNSVIWVEGITDKMYLQAYIDAFLSDSNLDDEYEVCKNYKEGINYSFALTGGDSIIHWDFSDDVQYKENFTKIIVKQFCAKSFVIVDNDNGKNPERKDILKECLGERFFELNFPEIENLLDQSVITKTVLDYPTVKKSVGNEKLPEIKMEHLQLYKVGYIIDNILLTKYSEVKKFCASNGGLKSGEKYLFCQRAIKHITPSNLSTSSIELVKRLLDFIKLQN